MTPARAPAASGLVVVDKPAGPTSHDVVARVRRLAGTRKVGHAGTLDPMATGVLVLGVGTATRLLGHLMLTDKAYDATIRLGVATTTDDAEGQVVATTSAAAVDEDRIRDELSRFVGTIAQVPAAVSAVKVAGRRAYQRVRAGEEVELPARQVTVHALELVGLTPGPERLTLDVDVSLSCSSGTYVRALARDLGRAVGVGGHLTRLRRTAVGPFGLDVARGLDALADGLDLLPIAEVARATFPSVEVGAEQARAVRHGRPLDVPLDGLTAIFAGEEFLALYRPVDGMARPAAVFLG